MADQNTPTNVFSDEDGGVYVQTRPGTRTYYVGNCLDTDALPNPKSDTDPIWCLDNKRNYQVVGRTKTAPAKITTTLTQIFDKTATWLEKFVEEFCPFYLHYLQHKCGTRGVWGHWERISSILVTSVTDDVISNVAMREGGNPTTRQYSLTAMPPRVDSRELAVGPRTALSVEDGYAIWACPPVCADDCGAPRALGESLATGHMAVGGGTSEVNFSVNSGTTWTNGATDPFVVNDVDTVCGVCVEIDKDTVRHIVSHDTSAGIALSISYTDNAGGLWTPVLLPSVAVAEAAVGHQSIFAFDSEHIWVCTDDGDIHFSSDGALTWTNQAAIGVSGGNPLNAIKFWDANVGYCVGDADTVLYTINGGVNWLAATGAGGVNLDCLALLGENTLLVGDSAGELFHSWDGGDVWTQAPWTGTAINSLSFSSPTTGFMIDTAAGPISTVYHTVDGGFSWRAMTTPVNLGLTCVVALSETRAVACGLTNALVLTAIAIVN